MGLADGTIFDSSSLDPGNYVIKLGMDKLVKMTNSVSLPDYTYNKNTEYFSDINNSYYVYYNTGVPFFNYGIDPTTLIFLCQFFGVEFSVDDLIDKLNDDYHMNVCLKTDTDVSILVDQDSDTEELEIKYSSQNALIRWPECIKIQIVQNKYCYPEDDKIKINRCIYSDLRIIDYSTCANYVIDSDYIYAYCTTNDITIKEYFEQGNKALYTPLLDADGNPRFTGAPAISLLKQNYCNI